jgi:transcriptional regulator with XRE-family HTH domain
VPLQRYRAALGLTQKEVADAIGITSEYYSQIERGRIALPNAELRRAISRVLGIRHIDFLVDVGVLDDWEVPGFSANAPVPDPVREQIDRHLGQLDLESDNRAETLLGILKMWSAQDRQRGELLMFAARDGTLG